MRNILAIIPELPDGWAIVDVDAEGATSWTDIEILWTGVLPASPVRVVMTCSVPVTSRGDKVIPGVVEAYLDGGVNAIEAPVPPSSIPIDPTDEDGDGLPDGWECAQSPCENPKAD